MHNTMEQYTLEQLNILEGILPDAKICGWRKRSNHTQAKVMPKDLDVPLEAPKGRGVLPNVVAQCSGRQVTLEFSPAPDPDSWWMNIYVKGDIALVLTLTAAETPRFRRSGPVPEFPITTADPAFTEKYVVASSEPNIAQAFIENPAFRENFLDLGDFDRFTADRKFIRLTQLATKPEDVEAEHLRDLIFDLVDLTESLETWNR